MLPGVADPRQERCGCVTLALQSFDCDTRVTMAYATHDGGEHGPSAYFFAAPDAVIGAVKSASTNDLNGVPTGAWARFRSAECTFVGTGGVARYRKKPFRSTSEVFEFSETTELRVDRESDLRSGSAIVTARYEFLERKTGQRFVVVHDDAFGRAAERAYSEYVIRSFDDELREYGKIHFQLNPRESIGVGPAFLELNVGRGVMRLDASLVEGVFVNRNAVEIRATATGHEGMPAQSIFRIRIEHGERIHALAVLLQELVGVRMK